jgi:hypothetical protein
MFRDFFKRPAKKSKGNSEVTVDKVSPTPQWWSRGCERRGQPTWLHRDGPRAWSESDLESISRVLPRKSFGVPGSRSNSPRFRRAARRGSGFRTYQRALQLCSSGGATELHRDDPEVSARVDADVLAQGGTRLNFDAHDLAEAPGESRYSSQTRYASRPFLKNAGARLGLMLTGAALATAAHAVFALVGDGTGFVVEQGSIPILGAWVRKFLSLAFGAPADPVRKFLARADVLGETSVSVETFKRAGYERREDFWGITETELENALQVTSPVHRRRVVRLADRMKASSARNDRFTETGVSILLFLICSAAFLVIIAACVNKTFRNRLGVYLGITCAICWFHMKTYLERVRLNKLKKNALRGLNKSGSHNARPTTTRSTTQSVSLVSKSSLKSVVGGETHHQHDVFQDDDSAFEGSRQGSPDRGIFVPSVTKQTVTPAGLTGSLCDATTREAVFLFREKWRLASSFRKARAELHNWRKSREEYPEYESELAKLKLLVPESEVTDATLRLCGDLDDTYRRFLSAQGGKAVKAEKVRP